MKKLLLMLAVLAMNMTAAAESGTMERFGSKMSYTISGGIVTNKSKAMISGVLRDDMTVLVKGEIKAGSALVLAWRPLTGKSSPPKRKRQKVLSARR